MISKPSINIVWFKRDYRLSDHAPLASAISEGIPTLLLGFLEPALMAAPQSDIRHWRFVRQSVDDINQRLPSGHQLHLIDGEVLETLQTIAKHFSISKIFSHEEVGIKVTYDRDKQVTNYCQQNGIEWIESPYAGVIRGIGKRKNWPRHWYSTMGSIQVNIDLGKLRPVELPDSLSSTWNKKDLLENIRQDVDSFQKGGEQQALKYLQNFFSDRVANYNYHISKPQQARKSCSRLSPYLAWGNLSMRQVYQSALAAKKETKYGWHISSFMSRLRWHCHFIQKFEMMDRYESENINPAYNELRSEWDEDIYQKWYHGETGYPLIDA
ncbi:MAG: deoxyribodipyrimidine photo-lyase, partial [Bacteroidota bacterium]